MELYLTLKALHIVAIVSWMAGLLYLPRLFVYHTSATGEASETFKIMEKRLYRFIMTPAMIASFVLGGLLIWQSPGLLTMGWLHAKITLVLILAAYHGYCGKLLRRFAADQNSHSAKFYRIFNEIPAIILVIVVFLVVFKSF